MLISHAHRFIFIHVDKAAGTSVQEALQPYAEPLAASSLRKRLMLLGPLNRVAGLHRWMQFGEHVGAVSVRRCLPPSIYDGYFKFGFVRNPWDRLVSRYHYLKRNQAHRHHAVVTLMAGFAEYARWEMARGKPLLHQHNYLCDAEGKLIVDAVGKFETLAEDFNGFCARLKLEVALPHLNATQKKDYRDFYSEELREEVGRFFERDVALFGYAFDPAGASSAGAAEAGNK